MACWHSLSALVVRTLAPLILVVALVLAGRRATRRGNEALGYLLMNSGVLLVFMVYPSVTQYCFRFFQVKTFDDVGDTATFPHVGGTYLIADYSVDADGGAYIAMTPFAAAMVCVWPFGVPLLIAILLWRSRAPLLEFRRREMILGGVYGGDAWAAHLAERTQIGEQVHASGQAEPEVDGYLWSLTESYSATVFYFEFLEYALQSLARSPHSSLPHSHPSPPSPPRPTLLPPSSPCCTLALPAPPSSRPSRLCSIGTSFRSSSSSACWSSSSQALSSSSHLASSSASSILASAATYSHLGPRPTTSWSV